MGAKSSTPAPAPAPLPPPLILPSTVTPPVTPAVTSGCQGVSLNTGNININGVTAPGFQSTSAVYNSNGRAVVNVATLPHIPVSLGSNVTLQYLFTCAMVVDTTITDPNGNVVANPINNPISGTSGPVTVNATFPVTIPGNYSIDSVAVGTDGSILTLRYIIAVSTNILTSPLPPPVTPALSGQRQLSEDPTSSNLWLWILIIIIILILLWLLWRANHQ